MSVTRITAAIGLLVALGLVGCNAEMRTALEESGEELKTLRREAMQLRAQLGTVERRAKLLATNRLVRGIPIQHHGRRSRNTGRRFRVARRQAWNTQMPVAW